MYKTEHPIEIALKDLNSNISVGSVVNDHGICLNRKWLLWDMKEWVVYERKRYARNSTILIKTDSIKKAVEKLIRD